MRKSLLPILLAASILAVSPSLGAAEPTVAVPSPRAEKAGRFVTRFFEISGSALEWTGRAAKKTAQGAGRAVSKMVSNLEAQRAAKP